MSAFEPIPKPDPQARPPDLEVPLDAPIIHDAKLVDTLNLARIAVRSAKDGDQIDKLRRFIELAEEKLRAKSQRREDIFCVKAMAKILDIDERQATEVFNFLQSDAKYAAYRAVRNIFKARADGAGAKRIANLQSAIEQTEEWLNQAGDNPLARRVMEIDVDDDEKIEELLISLGAKWVGAPWVDETEIAKEYRDLDTTSFLSLEGNSELYGTVDSSRSLVFEDFPSGKLTLLRDFHTALDTLYQSGGEYLVELYLNDLALEHAEMLKGYNFLQSVLRFKSAAEQLSFHRRRTSSGLTQGDELRALFDSSAPLVPCYCKIVELGAAEILPLFPLRGEERLEVFKELSQLLPEIPLESAKDIVSLVKLISRISLEDRLPVIRALAKFPEQLGVYKNTLRIGISEGEFANYLLVLEDLAAGQASERPVIASTVCKLCELNHCDNAALVIRNVLPIVNDSNAEQLLQALFADNEAYIIGRDFLQARQRNEAIKSEVLLRLLQTRPPAPQRKAALGNLRSVPEANLDPVLGKLEGPALLKALSGLRADPTTKASSSVQIDRERSAALSSQQELEYLRNRSRAAGQEQHDDLLVSAYNTLPEALRARLRNVIYSTPEILSQFCSNVLAFKDNDTFIEILRNPYLFKLYKEKLATPGDHSATLSSAISSPQGNRYLRVLKWASASPEKRVSRLLNDCTSLEDFDPRDFEGRKIRKIVVVGGDYSQEAKDSLAQIIPSARIEFFLQKEHRSLRHFRVDSNCLVIFRTDQMSHSSYQSAKVKAAQADAMILHLAHAGTTRLRELFSKIAA